MDYLGDLVKAPLLQVFMIKLDKCVRNSADINYPALRKKDG